MTNDSQNIGDRCLFRPSREFQDVQAIDRPMKLIINVSGLRFETFKHTVEQLPDSVLGSASKREKYWDATNNEFFFDRNRTCFEAILTYYQTRGILIRPATVPMNVFVNELKFFELGQEALWKATEGYNGCEEKYEKPKNRLQCKIWELFEYPDTSRAARIIAIFSITIILLSVVLFCIETLPSFQPAKTDRNSSTEEHEPKTRNYSGTFIIEALCICWFTLEYLLRLLSSPNKWKFVISVLNIIDLVAIIPFYISVAMANSKTDVSSLAILRVVRLVRVFRIFKLSRYSRGLQILGHTLRASVKELGLLLFFLCVGKWNVSYQRIHVITNGISAINLSPYATGKLRKDEAYPVLKLNTVICSQIPPLCEKLKHRVHEYLSCSLLYVNVCAEETAWWSEKKRYNCPAVWTLLTLFNVAFNPTKSERFGFSRLVQAKRLYGLFRTPAVWSLRSSKFG